MYFPTVQIKGISGESKIEIYFSLFRIRL